MKRINVVLHNLCVYAVILVTLMALEQFKLAKILTDDL